MRASLALALAVLIAGCVAPPPPGYYGRGYREAPRYAPQPRPQPYYWGRRPPAWDPGGN